MQIVSLFIDDGGNLRCCRAQDHLSREDGAPKLFAPDGAPIALTEIRVGAVETTPDGAHPAFLIPERYDVAISDAGPVLKLKDGAEPVPGITWDFPRLAADLPAWLDRQGIETVPAKARSRVMASADPVSAAGEVGIKDLKARGVRRMPERLRAWVTLTTPDLAREHGIDAGISLTAMLAAEKTRSPVDHPFKCRKAELARRIDENKRDRKLAVFQARQRRLKRDADIQAQAAAEAWQEMVDAVTATEDSETADETTRIHDHGQALSPPRDS